MGTAGDTRIGASYARGCKGICMVISIASARMARKSESMMKTATKRYMSMRIELK